MISRSYRNRFYLVHFTTQNKHTDTNDSHERMKHDEWNDTNSLSLFVNGGIGTERIVKDHEDLTDELPLYLLNDTGRPLYLLSLTIGAVNKGKFKSILVDACCTSCLSLLTRFSDHVSIPPTAVSYLHSNPEG